MADLSVDYQALLPPNAPSTGSVAKLEASEACRDDLAGAWGSRKVADAMREFVDNWDRHRKGLIATSPPSARCAARRGWPFRESSATSTQRSTSSGVRRETRGLVAVGRDRSAARRPARDLGRGPTPARPGRDADGAGRTAPRHRPLGGVRRRLRHDAAGRGDEARRPARGEHRSAREDGADPPQVASAAGVLPDTLAPAAPRRSGGWGVPAGARDRGYGDPAAVLDVVAEQHRLAALDSATASIETTRRHLAELLEEAEAAGALVARDIQSAIHDGVKDGGWDNFKDLVGDHAAR